MKKNFLKALAAALVICLALCGVVACDNGGNSGGGGSGESLAAVDPASIVFVEEYKNYSIRWDPVDGAEQYDFTCNDIKLVTPLTSLTLSNKSAFSMPSDGVFNIKIIAMADGRADSQPTIFTYTAKGVTLKSPEIKSFNNGVLEWSPVTGAAAYSVKVDGNAVSDNSDGKYHATTLDTKTFNTSAALNILITATGEAGDKFILESAPLVVSVNAQRSGLVMQPVTDLTYENGVLSWTVTGGVRYYRVVDINMAVAATIEPSGDSVEYDMTGKNLVYGVYPSSNNALMGDAEITPMNIPYLKGSGTTGSPYLISTPFDLRAIDYYEMLYAEKLAAATKAGTTKPAPNNYLISNDIDYAQVAALDAESNIYTLSKPFYGTLDGNNKKLSHVRVEYDGGYWALFDFIAAGATVKNLTFDAPEISNTIQNTDKFFPVNAAIATVANRNYGTISGIKVKDAVYNAKGGEVCGICTHNYGTVTACEVSGKFTQLATGQKSQACYEMAGVVLENYGTVSGNSVGMLTISGSQAVGDGGGKYNIVRTAAGVVAVNRSSGTVSGNSFTRVDMIYMLNNYNSNTGGYEFGGLVAYNAGKIVSAGGTLGTFTWSASGNVGAAITASSGTATNLRGKIVGKNDGDAK